MLHCYALLNFLVKDGQNARDEIAFRALFSFLVEVQTNAGYVHARMRKNNLEIRITGSPIIRHFKKFKTRQYLSERFTEACDQAALLPFLPTYALSPKKERLIC